MMDLTPDPLNPSRHNQLDAPIDHQLDRQLEQQLERHLDDQLAALARDIAPPRNLWHGIVVGIARPHRGPQPFALAAATACVILAGGLVWAVLHDRPASLHGLLPASPIVAAHSPAFDEPTDPGYTAMRTRLETTFHERLALLSPETRAQIETSLALIRKAHADIRKALASEPTNPVLQQLFQSTWHDEFDLYDRVVQATQSTLQRT